MMHGNYLQGGLAVKPSSLEDKFPVRLFYLQEDEVRAFAKGGIAKAALRTKAAGRYGDSEIIHVNKDELEELKRMWGEPTINPETGQPEFFLKGLKKLLKPLAPFLPALAMMIPGFGPLISGGLTAMGVGAGTAAALTPIVGKALVGGVTGGITGGGKGALSGALSGAIGGGAGSKLGAAVLGPGVSSRVSGALGNALLGGAASAAGGGDPLTGALLTGGGSYMLNKPGAPAAGRSPGNAASAPDNRLQQALAPQTVAGRSPSDMALAVGDGTQNFVPKPSFFSSLQANLASELANKNNLVSAIPGMSTAMDLEAKEGTSDPLGNDPLSKLQPVFNTPLPTPKGQFGNLSVRQQAPMSYDEMTRYGYGPERSFFDSVPRYAEGGALSVKSRPKRAKRTQHAVSGPGTGRSDEIPAVLSDGEYVMDAETVALLGDGSSKAGAKALDQFRVNVRKHKGAKLAKGRFSVNAKAPERYLHGGRV
jgi:hypothetical protein